MPATIISQVPWNVALKSLKWTTWNGFSSVSGPAQTIHSIEDSPPVHDIL